MGATLIIRDGQGTVWQGPVPYMVHPLSLYTPRTTEARIEEAIRERYGIQGGSKGWRWKRWNTKQLGPHQFRQSGPAAFSVYRRGSDGVHREDPDSVHVLRVFLDTQY